MDRELLRRVSEGDPQAREQLWDHLTRRLGVYFIRQVGDQELAMELAQRSVSALFEHVGEDLGHDPEVLWTRTLQFAQNRLRQHLTQLERDRRREDLLATQAVELELVEPPSMEQDYADAQLHALAEELFAQLPSEYQLLLELESEGYSFVAIAELLGTSINTVRRRHEAAIRRFMRDYEEARRTRPEFRSPPRTGS